MDWGLSSMESGFTIPFISMSMSPQIPITQTFQVCKKAPPFSGKFSQHFTPNSSTLECICWWGHRNSCRVLRRTFWRRAVVAGYPSSHWLMSNAHPVTCSRRSQSSQGHSQWRPCLLLHFLIYLDGRRDEEKQHYMRSQKSIIYISTLKHFNFFSSHFSLVPIPLKKRRKKEEKTKQPCTHSLSLSLSYMHVYIHMCMHAHTHTHACMHIHTHAHTHTHMHANTHACTHTLTHACTRTHTNVHIHTTHTDQQEQRSPLSAGLAPPCHTVHQRRTAHSSPAPLGKSEKW